MDIMTFARILAAASVLCAGMTTGARAGQDIAIPALATDPALHALLPDTIKAKGEMTVIADAHTIPCEAFDAENKNIIGIEPDMIRAIGQKLGIKVNMTSTDFPGVIPGLLSGRYDMAMSCLSDRTEREGSMTFIVFWSGKEAIYTLAGNPRISDDPLSLCGLRAAAQKGMAQVDLIKDRLSVHCQKNGKPAIELGEMPSRAAVLLALYSGRIDFAISDLSAAADLKAKAPRPIRNVTNRYLRRTYLGFAVRKDNRQLAGALLAAAKAVFDSGVYVQIMKKWKVESLEMNAPGMNLATSAPLDNPAP